MCPANLYAASLEQKYMYFAFPDQWTLLDGIR